MFDERKERRMARYRARVLSWRLNRKVAPPMGNIDGINPHWIHEPFRWADNGQPVTTRSMGDA